jgi:hypothetical protein
MPAIMPAIITIDNEIQCPHGGMAVLTTSNTLFTVAGSAALLAADTPIIAGCVFNISGVPSPCVLIQWAGAAESLTVNGLGVVLETSIGLCCNAAGAPQGPAIVNDATPDVEAI